MDKQQNTRLTKLFTRILLVLVLFECTAILGMLLTDEEQQLAQIRTEVTEVLDDESATQYIKAIHSWRIGPYQKTRVKFQDYRRKEWEVHASHWWGFSPTISCISSTADNVCQ